MHRIFSLLVALFALISPAVAQVSAIDDSINSVMEPVTNAIMKVIFFTVSFGDLSVPFVLIWLIGWSAILHVLLPLCQYSCIPTCVGRRSWQV